MKKIILLLVIFLHCVYAIDGELPDFTQTFTIRNLENGINLSANRNTIEEQNWGLREVMLDSETMDKDTIGKILPFGYVQFFSPNSPNSCLAIDESGFFVTKSCSDDLSSKRLETVFSIIPTKNASVQIRSLVQNGDECISTFVNPNLPIEKRFGILPCVLDTNLIIGLNGLFVFTPALLPASPL